jgi:hypothetical protein
MNRVTHQQLWQFTQTLKQSEFERDRSAALDPIGLLVVQKPQRGEYPSPPNGVQFAYTGGDFVTFSYLDQGDTSYGNSPVILTLPPLIHGKCLTPVVGENLYEFLCLGSQIGFFYLETYSTREFFDLYCHPDEAWKAFEAEEQAQPKSLHMRERSCANQKKLLKRLTDEFSLRPWTDVQQRLKQLQKDYMKLVKRTDWWDL